jgi:organic hydroperoxide reductase OsmC/OhrA
MVILTVATCPVKEPAVPLFPPATLERLIPLAQRVCYVTNTLRQPPEITISVA